MGKALAHRCRVMHEHGVDLVLDIGAHTGQHDSELRAGGFPETIVSFEPLVDQQLDERAASTLGGSATIWRSGTAPTC